MTGTYHVKISSKNMTYEFDIHRNITIIRGESATGKSTMLDLITIYNRHKGSEPCKVTVSCSKRCVAFTDVDSLYDDIDKLRDCIVFIDECEGINADAERFINRIKGSDNYYVLVTREVMEWIPYSIEEIYRIKKSNRYGTTSAVYNQLDRIYKSGSGAVRIENKRGIVITEDSGSGHEMMKEVLPACNVESASGKSNIISKLKEHPGDGVVAIVDGAAFGPEIEAAMRYIKRNPGALLYAPESFEWLLLQLRMFKNTGEKIRNTADYADSCRYLSWEQYYVDLLKEELNKYSIRYGKGSLPKALMKPGILAEFRSILPDIFK